MISTQNVKYGLQFCEAFPRAVLPTSAIIFVWASHTDSASRCGTPNDSNGKVVFGLLAESRSQSYVAHNIFVTLTALGGDKLL